MRWRYFSGYDSASTSTVDPDADPPEWPYVFRNLPIDIDISSSTDDPLPARVAEIATADTIRFSLTESNGVNYGLGHWIIDLIDADGAPLNMLSNYQAGCFGLDASDYEEVVEWDVRFVQFATGGGTLSIPNVTRLPTGELALIVDLSEMVPGTLTISARDRWSPAAPQEFGPLTFVYGEP